MDKNERTDYDIELMMRLDQSAKLLDMPLKEFMELPIPLGTAMVVARHKNLLESRYRYNKNKVVDVFTQEKTYGLDALITVVNMLFGGKDSGDSDKPKGAQNISAMRYPNGR